MGEIALRRWEIEDSGIANHWTKFLEFSGREEGETIRTKGVKSTMGKITEITETADPS